MSIFNSRSRLYPSSPASYDDASRRRPPRGHRLRPWALGLTAVALGSFALARRHSHASVPPPDTQAIADAVQAAGGGPADEVNVAPPFPFRIEPHVVARNERIFDALVGMSFSPEEVWGLVKTVKPFTDLSRVRSGASFTVWRSAGGLDDRVLSFQMALAPNKTLIAREVKGGPSPEFEAQVREIPYDTKLVGYTGEVDSTLWQSAVDAGMDPNLVAELADVFAFDVDFNTEVREGDRYRLVVEQKFLEGKPSGYGRILAAEYVNRGDSHAAFEFTSSLGETEFYSTDGGSLRRMFLRSPLKYRRISSRFSAARYHPILHQTRAHQGVDYAADVGTPVRAVGDGVIEISRYNGGCGNMVKIRHNSTYETAYCHLSGFGAGIKEGTRVHQGQVIGYVGQTGLATGPHLHFAFYERGVYVDPLSKKFPAADPVSPKDRPRFEATKAKLLPLLPGWPEDKGNIAEVPAAHPAAILPAP